MHCAATSTRSSCRATPTARPAAASATKEGTAMLPKTRRQVRLKSRPVGIPEAQHFEIAEAPLAEPREREFVVRNRFLSVDPAMRGWVNAAQNYATPVAI